MVPHPLTKKYLREGFFVELRIDSDRFSAHPDAEEKCTCPHCNGEATKPILGHEHPLSLLKAAELPIPPVAPSRGWGEDFWVRIDERQDDREQAGYYQFHRHSIGRKDISSL